ncbi:DUF1351 domain-containing protein [uncultured Slackia sp.]|uniref:DUF1351 domain-containing protein n=1 Tax=uncultured Slackia sp. TaxID=665903 RepID=UPI0025D8DE26|nr:DUF1351 domain-containing protein [uncultured Slackia sp.]
MAEEQVLEAEVIEEEASELAVEYSAPSIAANFDALEAHVRKIVAAYDGAKYDLTDKTVLAGAKNDRAYLNGLKGEIEARRKAVKKAYCMPLDAFEARCKGITSIIDGAAQNIKAQLDQAEEERKAFIYSNLKAHYEEFAELLAPVVPYEQLHEKQWLNKSFGQVKAEKALDAKVSAVARDWETLKAQSGMAHYDEAEREFFRTLDLGAALNAARRATEYDERIAEMKAAMEPEPVESEPIGQQPAPAAPQPMGQCGEPLCDWTIDVRGATRSQMEEVAKVLRSRGITGRIQKVKEVQE